MKKFLLVLGMITCLIGLTACSSVEEAAPTTITQEQALGTVENFMVSIADVVAQGAQEQYASDDVLTAAIDSYERSMADLGDYLSTDSCTFTEDEDGIIINGVITGSLRKGTVEMIFDEEYNLTSATTNVTYTFGESMTRAGLNTVMGMGTVFAVLTLIMALIACFNFIPKLQAAFAKKEKTAEKTVEKAVDKAVDKAVAQIAQNEAVQGDDLELIAVIAAAIAASEGAASTDGYVVRSIRRIR